MAQAHKLLAQVGYQNYILELTAQRPTRMLLGTWGVRTWNSNDSPIRRIFAALNRIPEVQLLVGYGNPAELIRSANILYHYPTIQVRFTTDSHAKYVLGQGGPSSQWVGALGSSNLSDSGQFNASVILTQEAARQLAAHHHALWMRACDAQIAETQMRKFESLTQARIFEPNSTQERSPPLKTRSAAAAAVTSTETKEQT